MLSAVSTYFRAAVGAAIALGLSLTILHLTEHPWLLASLGGSCVILFGMPDSEMATPRSLFGGHLISALVGLCMHRIGFGLLGGSAEAWQIAAVVVALMLMMLTRTIHSPAGANPIVIFAEDAQWSFLFAPLAVGLLVLFLTAVAVNNLGGGKTWPRRWFK